MKTLLIKVIKFIAHHFADGFSYKKDSLVSLHILRSKEKTLNYIEENMKYSMFFHKLEDLWSYTISLLENKESNSILEFGVFKGRSLNFFSKRLNKCFFYGFDSFEGLKEDWSGTSLPKGFFAVNKKPKINKNVILVEGWFDDTLPEFLKKFNSTCSLIHIDCDTYQSSKYCLDELKKFNLIKKGVLILFDEYFGYPGYESGEMKAFKELNIKYTYLAFSNKQVLCRIE